MIKTNIKMRVTPEQSKRVQEICFSNDIEWSTSGKILQDYKFIHLSGKYLMRFSSVYAFNIYEVKEIDADLFIKTNGTCEESIYNFHNPKTTNMTKDDYIASLENRLEFLEGCKKETVQPLLKKIENLHMALKKKVEKNKNQALEITKLLEQKKDLQDKLNQANRVVKVGIDNSANLANFLDKKDEIIKEKDTIISYLESKLK